MISPDPPPAEGQQRRDAEGGRGGQGAIAERAGGCGWRTGVTAAEQAPEALQYPFNERLQIVQRAGGDQHHPRDSRPGRDQG